MTKRTGGEHMTDKRVSGNLYKLMGGEGMTEKRFKTIRKLAREEWRKGNATGYAMLDLIQEVRRCHKEIERYAQFEEQYQRFKQKYEEFEQKYKEFEEQNQRYREALERIDKQASDIVNRNFDYVAVGNLFELGLIAREALEGGMRNE